MSWTSTPLTLSESERDELEQRVAPAQRLAGRSRGNREAAQPLHSRRADRAELVDRVDCSKHNGIDWDGILSCEFLGDYKPDEAAYHAGVRLLRLEPSQAMMVAAHQGDLNAAMAAGLHSAFVMREGETNILTGLSGEPEEYDVSAKDFPELADLLLA